jgi:biopolymer transport protein ExbD
MADIAFLLLIFFLVTTIFDEEKGLRIVLPEPQEQVEVSQKNILHLTIMPNGVVVVKRGESTQEASHSPAEIEHIWRYEFANNQNLIAAVKTHPDAAYRHMIAVLDKLQVAGADKISLQLLE